jgi:cobalt-zinc-cadmium efflux system outer membrane protein
MGKLGHPCWLLLVGVLAGCHLPPARDRLDVSDAVEQRTGQPLGPAPPVGVVLPEGIEFAQSISDDQAVLIALWNNAAFQELLVELQITRADLVQAGLLPNPEGAYFFPAPDKPLKYAFDLPIEALWLRPIRLAIAGRDNERASERLTQAALDLIRDTRQACADLWLADRRVAIAREALRIRQGIARLAAARVRAGDASPQEEATAQIDALRAEQDVVRLGYDVPQAAERLRNLMGVSGLHCPIHLAEPPSWTPLCPDADALTREAIATRPDALAAGWAVAAAQERVKLARLGWLRLLGVLDATSGNATGHEFGPAFRFTLPIFNWNQGVIARAEAELERARRQRITVHNQIILDVQVAVARYEQAAAELRLLQGKVRPRVDAAIGLAEKAYKEGNAAYVVVLETARQLIDTLGREAQLLADLRRARAELERSVGRRLDAGATKGQPP